MFPVEREEITYKRKKTKGKRQALLAQFDSEEVHHRLEDCFCPDCQGELSTTRIGLYSCAIKKSGSYPTLLQMPSMQ
ncbi:hypothetical protein HMPREF1045_1752 [Streptococcus mitis SK616]|nr:hypothetical protein HMPREF1045_1752 [Streptococcus mitis SK616]